VDTEAVDVVVTVDVSTVAARFRRADFAADLAADFFADFAADFFTDFVADFVADFADFADFLAEGVARFVRARVVRAGMRSSRAVVGHATLRPACTARKPPRTHAPRARDRHRTRERTRVEARGVSAQQSERDQSDDA
jgi:hypothetical protein